MLDPVTSRGPSVSPKRRAPLAKAPFVVIKITAGIFPECRLDGSADVEYCQGWHDEEFAKGPPRHRRVHGNAFMLMAGI